MIILSGLGFEMQFTANWVDLELLRQFSDQCLKTLSDTFLGVDVELIVFILVFICL